MGLSCKRPLAKRASTTQFQNDPEGSKCYRPIEGALMVFQQILVLQIVTNHVSTCSLFRFPGGHKNFEQSYRRFFFKSDKRPISGLKKRCLI